MSSYYFKGKNKLTLCERLGNSWKGLADYFDITAHERQKFDKGDEGRAIWEWLENRIKLQNLPDALKFIKREDLLSVLEKDWDFDDDINQQKANSILPLLPYLPDRKPQKDELKATIKAYLAQYSDKKQRPLICLIHGDENEYGNFIKCLLTDFLLKDKALSQYFHTGLREIELLFDKFHTIDKLYQEILEVLENETNVDADKKEAIANQLAKERRPVIIHARLLTKDLENWQDQKTIIDGFIEFWANWPKNVYAQHHLFLVFLSVIYEKRKLNFSLNWLRRKGGRKVINAMLLNQLETLNNKFPSIANFFEAKTVHGKVLPKLDSVKRTQVYTWIKTYEAQIKNFWNNTDALEREVNKLYENKDAIPMEELAPQLKRILTNPNE